MVYTYTHPTHYTSLQDSISSICKNILPFSFKKRRVPAITAAEQRLSKQQSENLKWQQDSFHHILNLIGLCKEGIVTENEVSAFRTYLLETLIASPVDHEPTVILRDKLIFLQELLYAKCISDEEYHASKRPLLQRLAVQGAEIDARDVIVSAKKESSNEEWSVIDLKDEKCSTNQDISTSKNNLKESSTVKKLKGAVSVFGLVSPHKNGKLKENNVNNGGSKILRTKDRNLSNAGYARNEALGYSKENPFWNGHINEKESESKSVFMMESLPSTCLMDEKQSVSSEKGKKKPFRTIFLQREQEGDGSGGNKKDTDAEEKEKVKSGKKAWVFDGFKKWKKNGSEDEIASLFLNENEDGAGYAGKLVKNPIWEGPDTEQIKRKLHPNGAPTDFFVDKVLGESIKKELSQIQTELSAKNKNVRLTDDQIEVISTRLPVDNADLEKYFPKSWCDQYGDIVLDVVRKEFKDHMREMGNSRSKAAVEKHKRIDDENSQPNLFPSQQHAYYMKQQARFSSSKNCRSPANSSSIDKGFKYNPFFDI